MSVVLLVCVVRQVLLFGEDCSRCSHRSRTLRASTGRGRLTVLEALVAAKIGNPNCPTMLQLEDLQCFVLWMQFLAGIWTSMWLSLSLH